MADLFQECDICIFTDRSFSDSPCDDCYVEGCPVHFQQAEGTGPEAEVITPPPTNEE